jgi:hypothetical protein
MTTVAWRAAELGVLDRLTSPERIQEFLDGLRYHYRPSYRSPRTVLQEREGACLDGALLAIAALEHHRKRGWLVDFTTKHDDDHVIAVFLARNRYGAFSKSQKPLLRYRPPIFSTLRELVMSYAPFYARKDGTLSLASYSGRISTSRFADDWHTDDRAATAITLSLASARHFRIERDVVDRHIPRYMR